MEKIKNNNIKNTERTFSYDEVQKIALDVMNLGMALRQDQLKGWSNKSGNEVLNEYLDKL